MLAQVIPVAGAVLGGGLNAYYTDRVCKAAFYLYRERFLAAKYGFDEINVTVEPADTLDVDYDESAESPESYTTGADESPTGQDVV